MKLQSLNVYRNFGDDGYNVSAQFVHDNGKIEVECAKELGAKIIELCMDHIVEAVQKVASVTVENILNPPIEAHNQLEHDGDNDNSGDPEIPF